MTKHKDSSYELILEKALEVVMESGAASLTFEAVAKKSGISRGWDFVSLPQQAGTASGDSDQYVTKDMESFNKHWEKLGSTPETMVKAELLCATEEDIDRDDEAVALLAAVVNNPALLDNVKPIIEGRYEVTRALESFEKQSAVLLALDGIYMLRALGLQPLNRKERKKSINIYFPLKRQGGRMIAYGYLAAAIALKLSSIALKIAGMVVLNSLYGPKGGYL